jgi:hypothetical protein
LRDLETEVFLNTERILPVPAILFEREFARQQLSILFPDVREDLYFGGDVISAQDMVMSWEAPNIWVEMLRNHFKILRCQSLASMLVQSATYVGKEIPEGMLVIAEPWAWIVFGRSGKLLHIKALPMNYPDDISYNLLSLGKHWGAEPSQTVWKVSGLLEKDSTLWKSPDRFFEKLHLWESAGQADDIPGHFFAHYLHYLSSK